MTGFWHRSSKESNKETMKSTPEKSRKGKQNLQRLRKSEQAVDLSGKLNDNLQMIPGVLRVPSPLKECSPPPSPAHLPTQVHYR